MAPGDVPILKSYVKLKHAVAQQVRALEQHLRVLGAEEQVEFCHQLMTKLAEDRFTLAVVGQFKRGKSSLMNAIVGEALLPAGVLPLTSAITILRYGPEPQLVIAHRGWSFEIDAPIAALGEYVTEEGNPGNRRGVEAVYVEYPSPFLRRGLEFVDTPGVGSAIEANTTTTYDFIPRCDAVIFVTAVDGPLAAAELEFLGRIREYVRKLFLVVNKMDLLPAERDDVLRFVSDRLSQRVEDAHVRLYPVSSRLALEGKRAGDESILAESGLPRLEADLAEFLAKGRMSTLLVAILDRAEELLGVANDQEALGRRTAIRALRERILVGEPVVSDQPDASALSSPAVLSAEPVRTPQPNVLTGLERTRVCPICRYLTNVLMDFMAHWQYLLATAEASQAAFAQDGGFCSLHTWQLVDVASPQGLSAGYPTLLEHLASSVSIVGPNEGSLQSVARGQHACHVCRLLVDHEEVAASQMADALAGSATRDAYSHSQGVCLRHLDSVLAAISNDELRAFLLEHTARRLDELAEDMRSFAIKHEGTRRYLQSRDERDAYLRAVIQVVGHRRLCAPWEQRG